MYSLSQIRNRVDALTRKFATELKILKVFPIAEEFSLDWAFMTGERLPLPDSGDFIRHLASWGFRFHTYTNLYNYLERCRERGDTPDALGIIASLFPDIPREEVADLLPYNQAAEENQGWTGAQIRGIIQASVMVLATMRQQTATMRQQIAPTPRRTPTPNPYNLSRSEPHRTHNNNRSARRRQKRQEEKSKLHPYPRWRGAGGKGLSHQFMSS